MPSSSMPMIAANRILKAHFKSKPKISSPLTIEMKVEHDIPLSQPNSMDLEEESDSSHLRVSKPVVLTSLVEFLGACLLSLRLWTVINQQAWVHNSRFVHSIHALAGVQVELANVLITFIVLRTLFSFLRSHSLDAAHPRPNLIFNRNLWLKTLAMYSIMICLSLWFPASSQFILELMSWITVGLVIALLSFGSLSLIELILDLEEDRQSSMSSLSKTSYLHSDLEERGLRRLKFSRPAQRHNVVSPLAALLVHKSYRHYYDSY